MTTLSYFVNAVANALLCPFFVQLVGSKSFEYESICSERIRKDMLQQLDSLEASQEFDKECRRLFDTKQTADFNLVSESAQAGFDNS